MNSVWKPNKKSAMTLSEVLVTLLIIGVISAITIPTVVNTIQDAQLKSAFKKSFSVGSQAWMQVVSENSGGYTQRGGWTCTCPDGTTADYNANDSRFNDFKNKFKVIKSCTSVNKDECWSATAETYFTPNPSSSLFISADGSFWATYADTTQLFLDTNGFKGPNKYGQDIFQMFLGNDGVLYFVCDDKSTNGKPVSSGGVCPYANNPCSINGRNIDMKQWLEQ